MAKGILHFPDYLKRINGLMIDGKVRILRARSAASTSKKDSSHEDRADYRLLVRLWPRNSPSFPRPGVERDCHHADAPGRHLPSLGSPSRPATRRNRGPKASRRPLQASGPIDVLVNNAGIGLVGAFEATPMAHVRKVFETPHTRHASPRPGHWLSSAASLSKQPFPTTGGSAMAGIHHVTAIAGRADRNVDFYTRVLGLRLVKRTVNFDDPTTWHLYFGDEAGPARHDPDLLPVGACRRRPPRHRRDQRDRLPRPRRVDGLLAPPLRREGRRPRDAGPALRCAGAALHRSRRHQPCARRRRRRRGRARLEQRRRPGGARDARLPRRHPDAGRGRPDRARS